MASQSIMVNVVTTTATLTKTFVHKDCNSQKALSSPEHTWSLLREAACSLDMPKSILGYKSVQMAFNG